MDCSDVQCAIVVFNREMDLWLKDYLNHKINHVSISIETRSNEFAHLTWTGKRIAINAGAIDRSDYIQQLWKNDILVVEYPIREDWTPCIGPFTCVSMVKRVLGLGPLSVHVVTPYQLYRYLRKE